MGKGKKKQAKNRGNAKDDEPPDEETTVKDTPTDDQANDQESQAESLIVVEVFEARSHNRLSAGQQLVTVFDGDGMFQVVTDQPVQQDDLVVYAKPGCVLPGTQQRVGARKVNGVKSQGHICNAYEVGWLEVPTEESLRIQEDWNMISGDVCPMGPPQGWVLLNDARLAEARKGQSAFVDVDVKASGEEVPDEEEPGQVTHGRMKKGRTGAFVVLQGAPKSTDDEETETTGELGKQSASANAFAGLMDDADTEEVAEEEPVSKSKAQAFNAGVKEQEVEQDEELANAKPSKPANAFAGLMGSESEEEDEEEEEVPKPAPSNMKGKMKAANAFAGLMDSSEDEDEDKEALEKPTAPVKDKAANAFAGLMDGSSDDESSEASCVAAELKPKTASAAGAFDALLRGDTVGSDSDSASEDDPSKETSKQASNGKEATANGNSAVSILEVPIDSLATVVQVKEAMAAEGVSKTRKQKLKQRLKKLEGEAESARVPAAKQPQDMPVDELSTVEHVEAAINAPGVSKTRKQKLKQRLKTLQDAASDAAEAPSSSGRPVSDIPVESLNTVEQVQEALNDQNVSKTRKQKLKQRLKQLQDSVSKGKGKKVSAAVAAMQREVEERRKAEEEALAAEEAERKAEEEARIQAELEAKRLAEMEEARAEAKRLEREKLRKEGKLLTAKQRAEAKRLATQRDMFLARAQEVGISTGDKPTAAQVEERRRQTKKRQKELEEQRAREKEAAEQAERERKRQAEKEAQRRKQEEEAAAAAGVSKEPAADNWEDEVPEAWDASDAEDPGDTAGEAAAVVKAAGSNDESPESVEDNDGPEGSTDEGSSEEESSDEESDSDSDWSTDSDDERERRLEEARARREARFKQAMNHRSKDDLRSPICCILGHVDTGKTKILDNIRRTNVQTGEAGGITQQIGATYIPSDAVQGRTEELRKGKEFDMKMPGLLVIDTPGHESFSNLRSRGSSLCDIAVLVVDIMHGLEQQTIESINLLKMRKSPFIIALNKIDRMYNWKANENAPVRDSLKLQEKATQDEFDTRCRDSMLALNEQGLNVELYWKNKDPRRFVNIVPTSAITGEGICDLMWLIVKLTQNMMMDRLMFVEELQCTVLEVKVVEGYGHTIDAVLINGRIREGDKMVICGLQGPIVTTARSLLTPHPLKELRVKNTYIHHKEIKAAQGIKISAPNLESAVAGTQLFVLRKEDDEEELKDLVMEDMSDIFDKKGSEGVCVQASTLGSLEALLEFLSSEAVQIPVSGINIGPVHKKDIMRANIMNEKKLKKYSCILAFDVPITREAQALAQSMGVTVFAADIIYHLFDMFTEYTQRCKAEEKSAASTKAVFPCRMRIVPNCVFNAKDPIVLGCEVIEGQLRIGTPITVPGKDCDLGKVIGLEKDHKAVESVERGDSAAVKIEATNSVEASKLFGRHFIDTDELVSKITRESIDALKAHFRDEMTRPLWELVIKLKKVFKID